MKLSTTVSGHDPSRLADIIERRIRERISAQTATPLPRSIDDHPPQPPRAPRRS